MCLIFQLIGTFLAIINTTALLVVISEASKHGIKPGAKVVIDLNIIITIYYFLEQVILIIHKVVIDLNRYNHYNILLLRTGDSYYPQSCHRP